MSQVNLLEKLRSQLNNSRNISGQNVNINKRRLVKINKPKSLIKPINKPIIKPRTVNKPINKPKRIMKPVNKKFNVPIQKSVNTRTKNTKNISTISDILYTILILIIIGLVVGLIYTLYFSFQLPPTFIDINNLPPGPAGVIINQEGSPISIEKSGDMTENKYLSTYGGDGGIGGAVSPKMSEVSGTFAQYPGYPGYDGNNDDGVTKIYYQNVARQKLNNYVLFDNSFSFCVTELIVLFKKLSTVFFRKSL